MSLITNEAREYIRENYKRKSYHDLAKECNVPLHGVIAIVHALEKPSTSYRMWSMEDDEYLFEHFAGESSSDIAKAINRTIYSVNTRAFQLGLKKSKEYLRACRKKSGRKPKPKKAGRKYAGSKRAIDTPKNRAYIKKYYATKTLPEIREAIGISHPSILRIARDLGLKPKRRFRCFEWTKDRDDFLIKHINTMTRGEIAKALDVYACTVTKRIIELGLPLKWSIKTHYAKPKKVAPKPVVKLSPEQLAVRCGYIITDSTIAYYPDNNRNMEVENHFSDKLFLPISSRPNH